MESSEDTLLYEGKAKKIFTTDHPEVVRIAYKNDTTAFNGEKFEKLAGKGRLNNEISSFFFEHLHQQGIRNHFVEKLSATEQLVRRVEIIPLEVVTRNIAAGSLSKRTGWEEGKKLPAPLVEFYYKNDDLGDPLLADVHIDMLGLASESELAELRQRGLGINDCLQQLLEPCGILLVDCKLEFGRDAEGNLLLADEISPDTCRFWDVVTQEKLDKDRFRRDLGGVVEAYDEIWRRLTAGAK
ncbi:MAG TPA: phosphoribosylaminoimidazolesuccinocarboxamide synthase [Deltaproteobacteria bacterium]|jgi:phosphoribosylaminoimidazole-succinocarboxamide synthase|nr:phosphoribosylaminoimidazolesuccinocarboxamide synthase [Deltaproteobacteria bacterium]|tara:strand:+ start:418 stop:1140 length:723 start_codon:yes stop_codon:yes gene_type:complete